MKVLITGGRGFIGSWLVNALDKQDNDITCVTRGPLINETSRVKWFRLDHASQASWDEIVSEKFDVIYHLGWSTVPHTAEKDPLADMTDNVGAGLRLLTSVKTLSPKSRLILASSGGAIYGRVEPGKVDEGQQTRPISAYGIAKLNLENYFSFFREQYGLDCMSARISNAYGPGQDGRTAFGAISTFAKAALANQRLSVFGATDIVRDYIFISDVCSALSMLASAPTLPAVLNVASGVGTSLGNIIAVIERDLGRKVEYEIIGSRRFDVPTIVLDNSLLKSLVAWEAHVSVAQGVARVIADHARRSNDTARLS